MFSNVSIIGSPQWILEGMHLVKQCTSYKIVDHYGVVVAGQTLRWLGYPTQHPLVFHLTDKGVQCNWLDLSEGWVFTGEVPSYNIPAAIERLRVAIEDSNWTLFSNNCEQWANFIIKGSKESSQLQFFGGLAALPTLGILLWSNKDN